MIVPVPRPPPQHMVTRPVSASVRSISCSSVLSRRAPVEPSGWPRAIAPPLTLTRSMSGESSRDQARTTGANASLTSNRSMSPIAIPLRSSSLRVAGIGPVSIITGSTPTVVWSTIRARGVTPSSAAFSADISSTAAAPSEFCDESPPGSRAFRELRRVARGHAAVRLERRLQPCQSLQRRVGPDPLVGHVRVPVDAERHDLAPEAPLLRGPRRQPVRPPCALVQLGAGQLPLVGGHLRRQALGREPLAVHQLPRPG